MQFVFQALTWGFLITLVPLLIHLINMLRHRRVKWAAMEFLLQSYKRHRRWVWLKQLLLLLMRMGAIALIVMLLAQWDPRGSWLERLGGRTTHHYVLLDDSYSMSERQGAGSVFETALKAVSRLGDEASRQTSQRFTLIRFSQAASRADAASAADAADLSNETVDANFVSRLEERLRALAPSQTAAGPEPALKLVRQMLDEGRPENNVVYVVSDFRTQPWDAPAEIREALRAIDKTETPLHLISAARQAQNNLAIESIQPDGATRAAGVPLFVNITVRNHGDSPATKVQVTARTVLNDPDQELRSAPGEFSGQVSEPQVEQIDSIPAQGVGTARVQVYLASPGKHVVEAWLPDDAVAADNRRWCVLELQLGEKVLAIEDRPSDRNAHYLNVLLRSEGQANTGLQPETQPSSFLRDAPIEELRGYSAVYLFGADKLDARAVDNLERYVREGGGLAIFMGPGVSLEQYNSRLYRDGEGLLPLPLGRDWLLPPAIDAETPDVEIAAKSHPLFVNMPDIVRLIKVERYIEPPRDWNAAEHPDLEVLATLHNGQPLAVERRFGEGRVVQFMSTFAPLWNDIVLGPNILMALNLQAHLASQRRVNEVRLVGSSIQSPVDGEKFLPEVRFVVPAEGGAMVIQKQAGAPGAAAADGAADGSLDSGSAGSGSDSGSTDSGSTGSGSAGSGSPGGLAAGDGSPGSLVAELDRETSRAGVYEAWTQDLESGLHVRRYALNIEPQEGDLRVSERTELLAELEPVKPNFLQVDEMYDIVTQAGFNPSLWIMGLLIALLVAEQFLAYWFSYHPARQGEAQ